MLLSAYAEDVFSFASTYFAAQENGYRPYAAQNGTSCLAASTVGAVTVKTSPGFDVVAGNPGGAAGAGHLGAGVVLARSA